jgi:serine/threonine protein kinase
LEYAHTEGIIHRDIKPSNIMLAANDDVKITDFGLAKVKLDPSATMTKVVGGTLAYMPPEQLQGLSKVDHRGDIYSLAMTMYEALAGRTPFADVDSDYKITQMIVEGKIPSLGKMRDMPSEIVDVVTKALRADPDKRYQSAEEMLQALEAAEKVSNQFTPSRPKWVWLKPAAITVAVGMIGALAYYLIVNPIDKVDESTTVAVPITTPDTVKPQIESSSTVPTPPKVDTIAFPTQPPKRSFLTIKSLPTGATVLLDGRRIGKTPLNDSTHEPGKHKLRLVLDGYQTYESAITIRGDKAVAITAPLKKTVIGKIDTVQASQPTESSVAALSGSVRLTIFPFGSIYVNNKRQEASTDYSELKLSPGTYTIRVENSSYGIWQRVLRVEAGTSTNVSVNFNTFVTRPVRCVDELGGYVRNAEIFVDGKTEGKFTPAEINIRTGMHTIEVRREGYESIDGPLRVNFDNATPAILEFKLRKANQ